MANPYQSPLVGTELPAKPHGCGLPALAVVLWIIGLAPTLLMMIGFLIKGLPEDLPPFDWAAGVGFGMGILAVSVLPAISFGLLGLACWQPSWRLAIAGALVLLADGLLIGALPLFFG